MKGRKPQGIKSRFESKFIMTEGCWIWNGTKGQNGYGVFAVKHNGGGWTAIYAHRFSYELYIGNITKGYTIDHLCRTPLCVNPKHLEAVTQAENLRRSPDTLIGRQIRRTHCPKGHPYSEYGYLDVVKYLIEKGADVHADDDASVKEAYEYGHMDVVNYLISKGAPDIIIYDQE